MRREGKRCVGLLDGDPEIGLYHLLCRKRKWPASSFILDPNVMLFALFLSGKYFNGYLGKKRKKKKREKAITACNEVCIIDP